MASLGTAILIKFIIFHRYKLLFGLLLLLYVAHRSSRYESITVKRSSSLKRLQRTTKECARGDDMLLEISVPDEQRLRLMREFTNLAIMHSVSFFAFNAESMWSGNGAWIGSIQLLLAAKDRDRIKKLVSDSQSLELVLSGPDEVPTVKLRSGVSKPTTKLALSAKEVNLKLYFFFITSKGYVSFDSGSKLFSYSTLSPVLTVSFNRRNRMLVDVAATKLHPQLMSAFGLGHLIFCTSSSAKWRAWISDRYISCSCLNS